MAALITYDLQDGDNIHYIVSDDIFAKIKSFQGSIKELADFVDKQLNIYDENGNCLDEHPEGIDCFCTQNFVIEKVDLPPITAVLTLPN